MKIVFYNMYDLYAKTTALIFKSILMKCAFIFIYSWIYACFKIFCCYFDTTFMRIWNIWTHISKTKMLNPNPDYLRIIDAQPHSKQQCKYAMFISDLFHIWCTSIFSRSVVLTQFWTCRVRKILRFSFFWTVTVQPQKIR